MLEYLVSVCELSCMTSVVCLGLYALLCLPYIVWSSMYMLCVSLDMYDVPCPFENVCLTLYDLP